MNVYEIVTEQIVKMLEVGTVPWRKPWASLEAATPRNAVSRKPYRGINVFMLNATKFTSPYWLTYRQADELGGHVREGEKSTMVIFWKVDRKRDPDARDGEVSSADRDRFILRYYRVFNVEQCELPAEFLAKLPKPAERELNSVEAIADCERIVANMPKRPAMSTGKAAYYMPRHDEVTLPERGTFTGAPEYYSTAFHELTHSTGHESRLNRDGVMGVHRFGDLDYSKEELVAEMGSAFLCAEGGISPAVIENQAAYIASWLRKFRDDKKMIVLAAAQAQKAADFILDRKFSDAVAE